MERILCGPARENALLTLGIVTYCNPDLVDYALWSLHMYSDCPIQVVIFDNGINERPCVIPEGLKFPVIHLKESENVGFQGGINRILAETTTPYFCMANDDVLWAPNFGMFWRVMLGWLTMPRVGMVVPASSFASGPQSMFDTVYPEVCETSFAASFCAAMPTQLLKDLGGLDEDLRHGEDYELCVRLTKANYRVICERRIFVWHIGHKTHNRTQGARPLRPGEEGGDESYRAAMRIIKEKHGEETWDVHEQGVRVIPVSQDERDLAIEKGNQLWRRDE